MKVTGPTKESTRELIVELEKYGKKNNQRIWIELSLALKNPSRQRTKINLWKINNFAEKLKGKTVVVPGKVLGTGELNQKLNVAAFEFSTQAKEKIAETKGKCYSLKELMETKPKASKLVYMKG